MCLSWKRGPSSVALPEVFFPVLKFLGEFFSHSNQDCKACWGKIVISGYINNIDLTEINSLVMIFIIRPCFGQKDKGIYTKVPMSSDIALLKCPLLWHWNQHLGWYYVADPAREGGQTKRFSLCRSISHYQCQSLHSPSAARHSWWWSGSFHPCITQSIQGNRCFNDLKDIFMVFHFCLKTILI